MNKVRLAAVALGIVGLAACDRSNEDELQPVQNEQVVQDLDALSDDAANLAAESQALESQAANLQQEAQSAEEPAGPETPADEDIVGM